MVLGSTDLAERETVTDFFRGYGDGSGDGDGFGYGFGSGFGFGSGSGSGSWEDPNMPEEEQ